MCLTVSGTESPAHTHTYASLASHALHRMHYSMTGSLGALHDPSESFVCSFLCGVPGGCFWDSETQAYSVGTYEVSPCGCGFGIV